MNRLKIATFNLWKNDGDFPSRIEQLPNNIRKNQFDIICLQEDFFSSNFSSGKYLNLELDYNYISTKTRTKFRNEEYSSSNLTVLSKYKIESFQEIYFKKSKEEERACQFLEIEFENEKVLVVNTHLCHLNSKNRVEQLNTILKKIDKYSCNHVFLCGDLNALPFYNEIQLIRKKGFKDKNIENTHEDKVILDYIFYKSDKKIDVNSNIILKGFSDHYCLLNSFKIDG